MQIKDLGAVKGKNGIVLKGIMRFLHGISRLNGNEWRAVRGNRGAKGVGNNRK